MRASQCCDLPIHDRIERFGLWFVQVDMRLALFALLLFHSLPHFAQHCGYDGAAIIVLRPHGVGDSTVIDGLRITLLDSNNVPMTHSGRPYAPFFRNNDRKAWDAPGVHHRPEREVDHLFPFAEENYVLVVGRGLDLRGCSVLVQDERPWGERPVYRQMVVPLGMDEGYSLCGHFNDTVYHTYSEQRPYAAVDITVFQR